MKSQRRHELSENVLVSEYDKARDFLKKHGNKVMLAVMAVVLVAVVSYVWYKKAVTGRADENTNFENSQMIVMTQGTAGKDGKAALEALAGLAYNAHNPAIAAKAAVLTGDAYLKALVESGQTGQPEQADENRRKAEEFYRLAINKYKDQKLQAAQAHYGLGVLYESNNDAAKAQEEFNLAKGMFGPTDHITLLAESAAKSLQANSQPVRFATTTSKPGVPRSPQATRPSAPVETPTSGPTSGSASAPAPASGPASAPAGAPGQ